MLITSGVKRLHYLKPHFLQKHFQLLTSLCWNQFRKRYKNTASFGKDVHVFLLGYHGMGYSGLQVNRGKLTIEGKMLKAMLKVGLITQEEFDNPRRLKLQRSSRTDSGVSAAKQIIAIETAIDKKLIPNLTESINAVLPPEIRLFAIKKVSEDFDCWRECTGRVYEYLLPTYAFAPLDEVTSESFRISDNKLNKLNEVLELYRGSHRFHNFTRDINKSEPNAVRYVQDISCSTPFIHDNIEFITICINGQSFLLHQIRKMIGLAATVMRGIVPDDMISRAFEEEFMLLPKAPPLGLLLEHMSFDIYHLRLGRRRFREALIWDDNVQNSILKFKEDYLYPSIMKAEKTQKTTLKWLKSLINFSFDAIGSTTLYYHMSVALKDSKMNHSNGKWPRIATLNYCRQ